MSRANLIMRENGEFVNSAVLTVVFVVLCTMQSVASLISRSILTVASMILTAWLLRSADWRKRSNGVVVLIFGAILAAYLPAIANGFSTRIALEASIPVLLGLTAFTFCALGPLPARPLERSVLIVISGLAVAAFAVLTVEVWDWTRVLGAVDPASGWLDRLPVTVIRAGLGGLHPNGLAMVLEIGIPLSVVVSWKYGTRWLTSTAFLGVVLFLTLSRGGWAGALLGTAFTWLAGRNREHTRKRHFWSKGAAAVGVIVSGLVLILALGRPSWLYRATLGDRFTAMATGVDMFAARPLTGQGPGSFLLLLDGFLSDETYSGTNRVVWNHAHNGFIQALLELGAWGTALLAFAAGLLIWSAVGAIRTGDDDRRRHGVALLGAMIALGTHSLVDVISIWTAPVVLLAALAGIVVRGHSKSPSRWTTRLVGVVASVPVSLFLALTLPAQFVHEQGLRLAAGGDWVDAADRFQTASSLDPMPAYEIADSLARTNGFLVDSDEDLAVLAIRAAGLPTDAPGLLNYAIAATSFDPEGSSEVLDHVVRAISGDEVALIQVGRLFDKIGRAAAADEAYTRALRINPWLFDSDIWEEVERGEERLHHAASVLLGDDPCPVIAAAPFVATAEALLEISCAPGSPAEFQRLAFLGDWEAVSDQVSQITSRTPDDPLAHQMQGMVAFESGDLRSARRSWAIAALLGDAYSALRLLQTYSAEDVPPEVIGAAIEARYGHSPVDVLDDKNPIYILGSSRYLVTHRRLPPHSPIAGSEWHVTTDTHDDLVLTINLALAKGED